MKLEAGLEGKTMVEMAENPVKAVSQSESAKSAPDNVARIDHVAALGAGELRHGDFAIFATGAHIGVQKYLYICAKVCPTMRAGWM